MVELPRPAFRGMADGKPNLAAPAPESCGREAGSYRCLAVR